MRSDVKRAGGDRKPSRRRQQSSASERARRTDESLVAAFVDVDSLKAVNDNHSHRAGDELLREVVDGLRRHMRSYDLIVRVGGDEFVCALPGVTLVEAQRRLNDLNAELQAGPVARSISFGLSELGEGDSPQDLIDRADHQLRANRELRAAGAVGRVSARFPPPRAR